jgi:S-adenosylmethionine/arginine decarboxylase-like enzyme
MYGSELVLDLTGCDVARFNYYSVRGFFIRLCDVIGAERVGFHYCESEPGDSTKGDPKTHGISAVQFLTASSITLHALDLTGELYVNVFTCGDLPEDKVRDCVLGWFGGQVDNVQCLRRG